MDRPIAPEDFSFGYYPNGWRSSALDDHRDVLSFETGYYGFQVDMADLPRARFGRLSDGMDYVQALAVGTERMQMLPEAELDISVIVDGVAYRAVSVRAGESTSDKRMQEVRLWESGRFAQNFELCDVTFKSDAGEKLPCQASLHLAGWPDSLALSLELSPGTTNEQDIAQVVWTNAVVRLSLNSQADHWAEQEPIEGDWAPGDARTVSLVCDITRDQMVITNTDVLVTTPDGQEFPVAFDAQFNSLVAQVAGLKRTFKGGYRDIRDYDEFLIDLVSKNGEQHQIPFMLYMIGTANSTGLVPILCDEDGVPTGIPVQLSKNWHYAEIGDYLRAYMMLPAKPGTTRYRLRIPYGFYGTLPSASHAQLSLVGWGANGRWDQLAIGCWGETFCLDMDMSPTPQTITDVRALMVRNGLDGKKWGWTDAGWGGDWFNVSQQNEDKLAFTRMKTAYLAHGPCLTDVRYRGFYGAQQDVEVSAGVQTMRTDDYMRTLQRIRYVFKHETSAEEAYLFRMDGHTASIPVIAYGNRDGLIAERKTPGVATEEFINRVALSGDGPWWIAFPGSVPTTEDRGWGTATRGLVIRSYRASFSGVSVDRPSITVPGNFKRYHDLTYDLMLMPPADVVEFKPGDWVEMDLEWITFPRMADDYYGPNETFRAHLVEQPASWRTVYREAVGNDLELSVEGGGVVRRYPIVIQATSDTVTVDIKGGVGFVPIRFDGLASADGHALYELVDGVETLLDQSVHGNDFWQTDYDAGTKTYSMSFNLPLDSKSVSTWTLRSQTPTVCKKH